MRRASALAVLVVVLVAATSPAAGTWSDETAVTGGTITSGSIAAPTLTCNSVVVLGPLGIPLLTKAVLTWTASSSPVLLDYRARVVSPGTRELVVSSNGSTRSTEITPDILNGLLGGSITVRVQAELPGTSWVAATDRALSYSVLGLTVTCS